MVLAVVAATFAARSATSVADVFVLIALTTLFAGVSMWLLGRLHLGGLVRYVPTTVVGAFVAGTGWILVKGGLDVMVGRTVGLDDVGGLVASDTWGLWVPGFALGVLIWLVGRSDRLPPIAMSLTIVMSGLVFFAAVFAFSSVQVVEDGGWLIGPFPDQSGLALVSPSEFVDVDWAGIAAAVPGMITVVLVAVLALLLNVTGYESLTRERVDVDAELRLAGVSNVVIAPLGAAIGFLGLADSVLLRTMGVRSRIVPLVAAHLLAVFGFVGVGVIGFVPRLIVGSLLVTIGLELLVGWLHELTRMVSKVEQLISIGIVLLIASVGILEGIGAGVAAASVVFIVRYSRVDPVRASGSGREMRSRVDRSPAEVAALSGRSDRLAVFQLHGYLFFGSLTDLGDRISTVFDRDVEALVLDFRSVSGVDTSGYEVIAEVAATAAETDVLMVISALDPDIRDALAATAPGAVAHVQWSSTLDEALELTETHQIAASGLAEPAPLSLPLSDALRREFTSVTFDAGTTLMEQGAESDGMLVVVAGELTAFRVDDDGSRHRLRRFGAGAMVGEIGLVTGAARSAEIVAETTVEALDLSAGDYTRLRRNSPHLAFELHEYIMRGQAARVVSLSEGVARLSR